jgi:hypothetical protein
LNIVFDGSLDDTFGQNGWKFHADEYHYGPVVTEVSQNNPRIITAGTNGTSVIANSTSAADGSATASFGTNGGLNIPNEQGVTFSEVTSLVTNEIDDSMILLTLNLEGQGQAEYSQLRHLSHLTGTINSSWGVEGAINDYLKNNDVTIGTLLKLYEVVLMGGRSEANATLRVIDYDTGTPAEFRSASADLTFGLPDRSLYIRHMVLDSQNRVVFIASSNDQINTNQNVVVGRITVGGIENPASVDDNNLQNQFEVYPNPTDGIVQVSTTEADPFNVAVYDVAGKEVLRKSEQRSNATLNLKGLSSGVYAVTISSNGKLHSEKVVLR